MDSVDAETDGFGTDVAETVGKLRVDADCILSGSACWLI